MESNRINIYSDGGARGNPGPAAIGAVIGDKKFNKTIGETTNNDAEYQAFLFAMENALKLLGKQKAKQTELVMHVDSELLYKQVRGEYKIKNEVIQQHFIKFWNKKQDFKSVIVKHVPREENKEADALVNEALDGSKNTGSLL